MRTRRFIALWLLIALILIGLMALAMFSDSAAAQDDPVTDDAAILDLVEAMKGAIVAQDADAYLQLVDATDPVFWSEHTYWVEDWAAGDTLDRFAMTVDDVQVDEDTAVATLTLIWALRPDVSYREAEFPVRFTRNEAGAWQFAGGAWQTLTTEHFLVHYFPGMEAQAEALIAMLPEIYDHAVASVDYTPATLMHIKLYDHPDDLGALIALSLPQISGWNEPGESLKLLVPAGDAPSAAVMAHELTHFLTFEMAGSTHGSYPWWLMEGLSEYVASEYWGASGAEQRIESVRYWAETGRLAPWDQISDFEQTPVDLWRYVYPQGYAFVDYVTETFGEDARNAWIAAMASDMDLDAATETVFAVPFDALSADFGLWLVAVPQ